MGGRPGQTGFRGRQLFRDDGQFLLGRMLPLVRLRDIGQRARVLRLDLVDALLVELNTAFIALDQALQFQPALLLRRHLMFEF